jgi:hypothetical protein
MNVKNNSISKVEALRVNNCLKNIHTWECISYSNCLNKRQAIKTNWRERKAKQNTYQQRIMYNVYITLSLDIIQVGIQ